MGMNDVISDAVRRDAPAVGLEENLRAAIRKLAEAGGTGLVVKAGPEVVGIVTSFDLMRSVVSGQDLDETKVAQFMTACQLINKGATKSPCVQVDENETVKMAMSIMDEAGVHNLLVSGPDGRAIGMVSAQDLLKMAAA